MVPAKLPMPKADFELLGRVFMAEIQNALPAQVGKSKRVFQLEQKGHIAPLERTLGGRFPVIVRGWALTDAGRFAYCQLCTDERYA